MTRQATASLVRQVASTVISAGYTALLATGHSGHRLPAIVQGIVVAFGPVLVTVEHYLSDPSTGTPPVTATMTSSPAEPTTTTVTTTEPPGSPVDFFADALKA